MSSLTTLPVIGRDEPVYEDPLDVMDEIDRLKVEQDAVILAHYYVEGEIQDIADYTGDSLKLARDATQVKQSTIVFAGVHFMAESAKIMNREKRVLIPDLLAGCSLATAKRRISKTQHFLTSHFVGGDGSRSSLSAEDSHD